MKQKQQPPKIVIAHRGASGYLPEHTLPAKAMAYAQGADFLEQDLVMTRDDQLIVVHDHFLDRVTDVANQYPSRARTDGRFYAIDFTLAEIRNLNFTEGFDLIDGKSVQTYPLRFPMGKSHFCIHTFEEEIEFIQGLNYSTGKNVGLYPEIKAPWLHKQAGKDITRRTLEILKQYGYHTKEDNVYLQCFDPHELKRIRYELMPEMNMSLKMIQLIAYTDWHETYELRQDNQWHNYNYDWMFSTGAAAKIARYADGIGPDYHMLFDMFDNDNSRVELTIMAKEAKQIGLVLHPYTLRIDSLPPYANDAETLFSLVYQYADVEGAFSDFTDRAVAFLNKHQLR